MRSLAPLLVLALLACPLALAGTLEDPEVRDAANDQQAPTQLTGHTDLLAAWIHSETEKDVKVSLKLASLDDSATARYEFVGLSGVNRRESPQAWGVGADLSPQGRQFFLLRSPRPGCTQGELSDKGAAVPGSVRPGGILEWTLPLETLGWEVGEILLGFCASSLVESLPKEVRLRDSAQAARTEDGPIDYQVGASRLVKFGKLHFDAPDPLLTDPPEEDAQRQGSFDLTGLYYEFLPRNVNITLRTRSFALTDLQPCPLVVSGSFSVDGHDRWDYLSVHLRMAATNGTVRKVFLMDHFERNARPEVLIQEGTPGYVRFSYPRSVWGNHTDVVEHSIHASTSHCKYGNDMISYYDESFWSPGVAWLGAVAALAVVAAARRRR